jgi:hypothetical protein
MRLKTTDEKIAIAKVIGEYTTCCILHIEEKKKNYRIIFTTITITSEINIILSNSVAIVVGISTDSSSSFSNRMEDI